jgi:hypothetical protein
VRARAVPGVMWGALGLAAGGPIPIANRPLAPVSSQPAHPSQSDRESEVEAASACRRTALPRVETQYRSAPRLTGRSIGLAS